jgi:hypothetical protein
MQIGIGALGLAGYALAIWTIWQDEWHQLTKARVVAAGLAVTVLAILFI